MKISSVRLWFFHQSEFAKKSNSINRGFHHWKQWWSEHWSQWNYFPTEQIILSMEKWSRTWNFSSFVSCRETKKIHSYDVALGSFAPIEFCLALETGHKWLFSMKISSVWVCFFDQSEFGKKSNSINRLFDDWKRWRSEQWLEEDYFPLQHIVFSMEKPELFGNLSHPESKKHSLLRISGWFYPPGWVLCDLRNRWQVHFLHQNYFCNTLICQPIRIRQKESNSINRVFEYRKRRTTEQLVQENYFRPEEILLSMEKWWRRLNFLVIYLMRRTKNIHSHDFPIGSLAGVEFFVTLETRDKCISSIKITSVTL